MATDPKMQEKIEQIGNSVWGFFVQKRAVTWLAIIAISVFGLFAFMTLPREIQPEINIPMGAVSTFLPGANTQDTESLLTDPLEKEIGGISGIKSLSSSSGSGSSTIIVEFDTSTNMDKGIQDLKDAVDRAKTGLPEDATSPMVIRVEANDYAIITYTITGNRPVHELTKISKDIQTELEKISGVSEVKIVGGQEKNVEIILDQNKLQQYGLDISTIAAIIKYSNANLPLGVTSFDQANYSIRVDNRYQSLEEIRNTPLLTMYGPSQTEILVKDIAEVKQAYPEQKVISKFSVNGEKSMAAVSIQIYKKIGGNILDIVDNTKTTIDELKTNGTIPSNVDVGISNDNSEFIKEDLGILIESGVETTILIVIILFLALGLRQGLITGLAVPLGFFFTFAFMSFYGLTINSLSLFSLVIALGIAVDVSIVIMQGIHANMRDGYNKKDAALLAIDTYKWPLISGAFTTIFAFSPMLLVSGLIGEFLKTLPIVISVALIGFLFIGLTITPSISVGFVKEVQDKKSSVPLERILNYFGLWFRKFIEAIVEKRSVRIITIFTVLLLFIASLALPISGLLKSELFPVTNQNYFIISVETPPGVILGKTEEITKKVEEVLYKIPEIKNFLTIIGSDQSPALSGNIVNTGGNENSNLANITVNLIDKNSREKKSYDIAAELEKELKKISGPKITITEVKEGPPSDAAITIKVFGDNFDELKKLAEEVRTTVEKTPGTKNAETSLKAGTNEFKFILDRDALSFHGLSAMQVAGALRNILQGVEATTIKINDEDTDVLVKYNLSQRNNQTNISLHDIENFEIASPKGYNVNLSQLGKYDFGTSPNSIAHEDQKRVIQVTSGITEGANSIDITKTLQEKIDQMEIPKGYEVKFGGDFEEIANSFNDLYKSMIIGIILIGFTLVLEFNSFKQAFLMLLTLPMGLIGVFPGLYILGLNLSFPAFLGIVALTGVVVNHAIVLIDRINKNRESGMRFPEAIAEATHSRFEPIFITTITAIVGILPLALTNEFWAGLGFSLIFGLSFSTLLTLVSLPIVYYTFELKNARKNGEL